MQNFVDVVGLRSILDRHGIQFDGENFEALYSQLVTGGKSPECVKELERAVFEYFAALELPDEPTLYDHLILSLRPKDLIVTFNWDPFLWQALTRVTRHAPVPMIYHLHGNVAIGYCDRQKPGVIRPIRAICGRCGEPMKPSRLLFPVAVKDYQADSVIAACWRDVQRYLESAFMFTILGYSAPATDVEAVTLLKHAWGNPHDREMEEIEIIDVKPGDEISRTWKPFICREHYQTHRDFYTSMIALHPRRSIEAMWDAVFDCSPRKERPLPRDADWSELLEWYRPLLDQEMEDAANRPKS